MIAVIKVETMIKDLEFDAVIAVHVTFDGVPYDGRVVKTGTPCHMIFFRR